MRLAGSPFCTTQSQPRKPLGLARRAATLPAAVSGYFFASRS